MTDREGLCTVAIETFFWFTDQYGGGLENMMRSIARAMVNRGHACEVFTRWSPVPEFDPGRIEYEPGIGINRELNMDAIIDRLVAMQQQIDCLLVGDFWGLNQAEGGMQRLQKLLDSDIPIVWRTGSVGMFSSFTDDAELRRRFVERVSRFIVISSAIRNEAMAFGVPWEKIALIFNPVDAEIFRPVESIEQKQAIRKSLGLPEEKVIAIYNGRLSPEKGIRQLLQFWNDRSKEGEHLLLVGGQDPNERPGLPPIFPPGYDPHEDPSVTMTGILDDRDLIAQYFRAADVFLFLVDPMEGLGSSLLEAMACALPCIVSVEAQKKGLADLIIPEQTGLVCRRNSPASIRRVMNKAISPQMRETQALGIRGRDHIKKLGILDPEELMTLYEQIFRAAAGTKNVNIAIAP